MKIDAGDHDWPLMLSGLIMPAPWFPEPSALDAAAVVVETSESPTVPLATGAVVPLVLLWS